MDINIFATMVVLASVVLTLAGALGYIRDAITRSESEADADVAALFPVSKG